MRYRLTNNRDGEMVLADALKDLVDYMDFNNLKDEDIKLEYNVDN